jgi:hypothetical protein
MIHSFEQCPAQPRPYGPRRGRGRGK